MNKSDPSPFETYEQAADALTVAFMGEHIASPNQRELAVKFRAIFLAALTIDGVLPNDYEIEALVGAAPEDGTWPAPEEPCDFGCPEDVQAKFPATDAVIAEQF